MVLSPLDLVVPTGFIAAMLSSLLARSLARAALPERPTTPPPPFVLAIVALGLAYGWTRIASLPVELKQFPAAGLFLAVSLSGLLAAASCSTRQLDQSAGRQPILRRSPAPARLDQRSLLAALPSSMPPRSTGWPRPRQCGRYHHRTYSLACYAKTRRQLRSQKDRRRVPGDRCRRGRLCPRSLLERGRVTTSKSSNATLGQLGTRAAG